MKKILIIVALVFNVTFVLAQGIIFDHGTMQEIYKLAKEKNKLIFVDVYTEWCGPCKKMSKEVFTNNEVGKYYNANFINYKLDAEKGEGPELAKKWGVTGYPTYFYLNSNGDIVYTTSGAVSAEKFIEFGKTVSFYSKNGGQKEINRRVQSDSCSYEFLKEYYKYADDKVKKAIYARYMLSMPDEILFDIKTGEFISSKDFVYYKPLMDRITKGLLERNNRDKDYVFSYTFPVLRKISLFFEDAIKKENMQMFNELLIHKKTMSSLPQSTDKDAYIKEGRGIGFVSPQFLKLKMFSTIQTNEEEFKTLFPSYMESQMRDFPIDTLSKSMEQRFVLYSHLKTEKGGTYSSLVAEDLFGRHSIFAKSIYECVFYYWLISNPEANIRNKCKEWIIYTYKINPYNYNSLFQAVDLMIKIGEFDEALDLLEQYIPILTKLKLDSRITRQVNNTKTVIIRLKERIV